MKTKLEVKLKDNVMVHARNTVWCGKRGMITIGKMSTPHLERAFTIVKECKYSTFNGYSRSYLEMVINTELQNRNKLGTEIIKKFPKFNAELNAFLNNR